MIYEYESFREEIVQYLLLTQRVRRYTAEDIFHDNYEVYAGKIIKGEIDDTWERISVLKYIKVLCKYTYFKQFGKTKEFKRSKYQEAGEKWEVEYNIESESNRLDKYCSVKYLDIQYDTNVIMNELEKNLTPNQCKIYKLYLEDYNLTEIGVEVNSNKVSVASILYKVRNKMEPKIKRLMYG